MTKEKLQIIDLVRGFCILSVMAQHLGTGFRPAGQSWLAELWFAFSVRGMYGVSLFFVISGFLITRLIDTKLGGISRPQLKVFYARRVARIIPLLLLVVTVGTIFLSVPRDSNGPDMIFRGVNVSFDPLFFLSILTFMFNLLVLIKELILHQCVYGLYWVVLWSLSIEEQFYFIYPFILKYFSSNRFFPLSLVLPIFLGIGARWVVYLKDPGNFHLGIFNSFSGFEEIAIGVILYLAFKKYQVSLSANKAVSVFVCVSGVLVFLILYLGPIYPVDFIWEPSLFAGALFLFLFGGLNLEFFNSSLFKVLAYPGKLSYGMYLWHSLVLFLLQEFVFRFDTITAFAFFVLATVFLSSLSYYLFEMPLNRQIRKLIERN